MSEKARLLLVDGHALAYRAYHAIAPLTSPNTGEPTNAVFGFANMLLKAVQDYAPKYVVASFDLGRTFRHDEYAEYKATRARMPDDMRVQIGRIQELLAALGIPVCTKEGYEADDVLGTLARQGVERGLEVIIVTGDSDTFQLVAPDVRVLTPRKTFGEVMLYDVGAVRERYGLEPAQLVDLKALVGDTSDNIKGVPGVGEKTATDLLQQFGSVDGIYEHLEAVKPRFRKALEDGRQAASLSRHLVTIVRDLDLDWDLEAARWGHFDREAVMRLLRELDFRSLAARLPREEAPSGTQLSLFAVPAAANTAAPEAGAAKEPLGDYRVIASAQELLALLPHLQQAARLAVDTETTALDAMRAALVGISLSVTPGSAYYLPVGHDRRLERGPQLDLEVVRRELGPLLADPRLPKIGHNIKYDMTVLARHGLPVEGVAFDSMIAAWILDPSGRGLGLKSQAWQRLGLEMTEIEELLGKAGRKQPQLTMDQVPIAKAAPYAAADADMVLRLMDVLRPEIEKRNQWQLLADMEMPLTRVLLDMEMRGMVVDAGYLEDMAGEMAARLSELAEQIHAQAGHPFNINSTRQLATVLFDELKLKAGRRTTTGYSTDSTVLEELRRSHPIVDLILEYRQVDKIKGTYVDALPLLINPQTGRVHTSFNQAGASTGRLSSSDPNLQNIPIRSELGRRVRGAFVAPEGSVLLGCDYSQVELRVLAHVSADAEMVGAFLRGEDVHASTAAAIYGVALSAVRPEQRAVAKQINFGLMYGMGAHGLSARTDLSDAQARQFIEAYFARFQGVRRYLDETKRLAREQGYVETLLGRRRYFPEFRAGSNANQGIIAAAERAAVNMPIQGTAADIIKLAMIALDRELRAGGFAARMVLQVHDELVLEVPTEEVERVTALVVTTMENAYKLRVPLRVNVGTNRNWMEMK
jgi:DNA polymerase I